jgi:NDP-sugar pyrophosphorylase family protein
VPLADTTGAWDPGSLPGHVVVGADCRLESRESFAHIAGRKRARLVLGDRVQVYGWTDFNVEQDATLVVGDESVLVGAVFMCAERIEVGRRVVISYNVIVADSDMHPRNPVLRHEDTIWNAPHGDQSRRPPRPTRPVVIEDDVRIGIGAIVLKGVRIGAGAEIAPGAVVRSDVPPGAGAEGNPATIR